MPSSVTKMVPTRNSDSINDESGVHDKKRRLQFDFSGEAVTHLDELVKDLNATSRAEVVRRALSLLSRVTVHINDGGAVILRSKDGSQEERVVFL